MVLPPLPRGESRQFDLGVIDQTEQGCVVF